MTEKKSVRAITTRYKGYNFRSRLEARWAVFFDHLGVRWDYEPEGFELGNGLRYLPDFWLPDAKMWVEIKPGEPDDVARQKAWRLVQHSNFALFMSNGMPDNFGTLFCTEDVGGKGDNFTWYQFRATVDWKKKCSVFLIDAYANELDELCEGGRFPIRHPGFIDHLRIPPRGTKIHPLAKSGEKALEAARGARFEFGEKGGA